MEYIKQAAKTAESGSEATRATVEAMLADIRANGEAAVREIAKRLDNWDGEFVLSDTKRAALIAQVPESVKEDIRFAHDQIRAFADAQRASLQEFSMTSPAGVRLGQRVIPVDAAGCYVPGGRFAHACSALMSVATAKAAGVPFVVAASPPRGASIDPAVCYAMTLAGADVILEMGGVQAIASMAYGLFTGRPVTMLAGPGNAYVAEAKAILAGEGQCGIDVFAGPTDSLIVADETADAMSVAIDLLSQAEHGYDSPVWLVTTCRALGEEVLRLMPELMEDMPSPDVPRRSWADYGEVVLCADRDEMAAVANRYAPEHLQLMAADQEWWLAHLTAYGSLFIGDASTVPQGDKCSGTNHILPTKRAAAFSGGLNTHKFMRICTYQEISPEVGKEISARASRLSRVEGMEGHARACDWRLTKYFPDTAWSFPVYKHIRKDRKESP